MVWIWDVDKGCGYGSMWIWEHVDMGRCGYGEVCNFGESVVLV